MRTLLFITLFFCITYCNSFYDNSTEQKNVSQNTKNICIPDSNNFLFKHISQPLHPVNDIKAIKLLNVINEKQYNAWFKPMLIENAQSNKMVSFQNKLKNYYSFILMRVFDFSDEKTNTFSSIDQYIINVDNTGHFIAGLKIQDNFRTDNQDTIDFINGALLDVWSKLSKDTIKVYEVFELSNNPNPASQDEIFQIIYENVYFINDTGGIVFFKKEKIDLSKYTK